ncbi:MAG: peptidoglycan-binding domain-containing protein [Patescibacteria group bacterium]
MKKFLCLLLFFVPTAAFAAPFSEADLRAQYISGNLKVIIVPGHDPVRWGTQFGKGKSLYKEGELNLTLAYHLRDYLAKDPKISVQISREKNGEYADWLKEYVEDSGGEILAWRAEHRAKMKAAVATGSVKSVDGVQHNTADQDTATYLTAINKYANETDVALVLHVHFNDYCCHGIAEIGKYTGYTIYIPERQYGNAVLSRTVGEEVSRSLGQFLAGSTLPIESAVVVEDQDLIAIGQYDTRDGASLLVEYGYIYDPHIRFPALRPKMLKELAYQTYDALERYLNPSKKISTRNTTILPHQWSGSLAKGMKGSVEVLALQYALRDQGVYPPYPLSLRDCPLSGTFGDCTEDALANFQEKQFGYATGEFGPKTRALLNTLYRK